MKNNFRLFSFLTKLAKDRLASTPRLLARLLGDEDGSYLIYGITMLPILIGVAGLGTEASLLFYNHRTLQSAADAAVYSAAISYSFDQNNTNAGTQANAVVASYGFALGSGNNQANVSTPLTVIANYAGSNNTAIQIFVSQPQSAIFSGYYGFSALSNNVSATAIIAGLGGSSSGGGGNCVLAFGNTASSPPANAPDAIQLQGNATINAPGCGIYTNSNDCGTGSVDAIALGGNAAINAGSLGSAGCVHLGGNSSVNLPGGGTFTQNDGTLSNPLAGVSPPTTSSSGSCTATPGILNNGVVSSPGQLCPGVYSQGLKVDLPSSSTSPVTLQPGTYILNCSASTCVTLGGPGSTSSMLIVKNGTLTDTLDASGNGVTLVFDCSTCASASQWPQDNQGNPTAMLVEANGNVNLTAGPSGYVIQGGTDMPLNTVFDTQSNPNVTLTGTVYVPNGFFKWGGNPSTGGTSSCLSLIVNKITLYGDSSFSGTGCNSGGVASGSGGAGIPIGNVVTLVD